MLLIKIVPAGGQSSYKAEVNMIFFIEQQLIHFISYFHIFASVIKTW